jgi:proteasome lid subunit RPN8/RPN11
MENPQGLEKFQVTDREECGVIIKGTEPDQTYIVRIPNVSENPDDYAILLDDVHKVQAMLTEHEELVGFFHTHLPHHECEPSDADLDGAELFPGFNNLIYKPDTGEVCWYGVLEEVEN